VYGEQHDGPDTDDPVLQRFKAALDAVYGDEIDRSLLFGSRARGCYCASPMGWLLTGIASFAHWCGSRWPGRGPAMTRFGHGDVRP
jgi:hypothetical protein